MSESASTTKKDTAKTETTSTDSSSSAADSGTSSSGKSSSGGSASSRPISYFSSVSTDAYRSGWDNVFNDRKPAPRPRRRAAAPATLELDISELDEDLRAGLEEAFRRKARSRRLAFDKRRKAWRLVCELGG